MALSTIVVVAVLVVAVFSIDVIASVYSRHCGAPLDDIDGRIGVNHALTYLLVIKWSPVVLSVRLCVGATSRRNATAAVLAKVAIERKRKKTTRKGCNEN